jgi:hypothetical protein
MSSCDESVIYRKISKYVNKARAFGINARDKIMKTVNDALYGRPLNALIGTRVEDLQAQIRQTEMEIESIKKQVLPFITTEYGWTDPNIKEFIDKLNRTIENKQQQVDMKKKAIAEKDNGEGKRKRGDETETLLDQVLQLKMDLNNETDVNKLLLEELESLQAKKKKRDEENESKLLRKKEDDERVSRKNREAAIVDIVRQTKWTHYYGPAIEQYDDNDNETGEAFSFGWEITSVPLFVVDVKNNPTDLDNRIIPLLEYINYCVDPKNLSVKQSYDTREFEKKWYFMFRTTRDDKIEIYLVRYDRELKHYESAGELMGTSATRDGFIKSFSYDNGWGIDSELSLFIKYLKEEVAEVSSGEGRYDQFFYDTRKKKYDEHTGNVINGKPLKWKISKAWKEDVPLETIKRVMSDQFYLLKKSKGRDRVYEVELSPESKISWKDFMNTNPSGDVRAKMLGMDEKVWKFYTGAELKEYLATLKK